MKMEEVRKMMDNLVLRSVQTRFAMIVLCNQFLYYLCVMVFCIVFSSAFFINLLL